MMTERHRSMDELVLIEQMRELRQSERAPDAVRERLSARLLEAVEAASSAQTSRRAEAAEGVPPWPLVSRFAPASGTSMAAWLAPLGVALLGLGAAAGHWATRWADGAAKATVAVDREPAPQSALVSPEDVAARSQRTSERMTDTARPGGNESHGDSRRDDAPLDDPPRVDVRARPGLGPPPRAVEVEPAPLMTRVIQIPHWHFETVAVARGDAVVAKGRNLVTNGDFTKGDALWSVRVWDDFEQFPATLAPHRFVDGALCVALGPGEHRLGGWPFGKTDLMPHSFALAVARPYRLSLRAWVSGSLAIQLAIKVGDQAEPHTQTIAALVPVTGERQSFTVDFTAPHSEPDGGVAWLASAAAPAGQGELCVDDISVTMR